MLEAVPRQGEAVAEVHPRREVAVAPAEGGGHAVSIARVEREGVRFALNTEVTAIRNVASGGFELDTSRGAIEADVVVNVAGPHSARVNEMAGVKLPLETRPLRREVHALSNPTYGKGEGLPIVGDLNGGIYFRPESGGRDLIVGTTDPDCDPPEWLDDPDDYEEGLTEAYRQRHCLRLMKRFPDARLGPTRGVVSLYDVTVRDWYPIADRTDLPGYYVCIGTSGSSFKTAPVLAMILAGIIETCEAGGSTDTAPMIAAIANGAAHGVMRRRSDEPEIRRRIRRSRRGPAARAVAGVPTGDEPPQ